MENRNTIVNGIPLETERSTTAGSLMERLGADREDWMFEQADDGTSRSKARPINRAVYIPERFRRAIELHILKNMLAGRGSIQAPLLLGIHGPTGVGKTYQCECVLTEMGIASFLISGGQLESLSAGEPAQLIRTTYKRASDAMHNKECQQAVILINDFDTACGNWGELVQYTVNRQTIFSELMHLTDYPHSVEGRTVARIPIILTGNDFTRLYSPLVRTGRMVSFKWEPTREEKAAIVSRIFPKLSQRDSQKLVAAFANQPLAFYTSLAASLLDDELSLEIQQQGAKQCMGNIEAGSINPSFIATVDYKKLVKAGRALNVSSRLKNHLAR